MFVVVVIVVVVVVVVVELLRQSTCTYDWACLWLSITTTGECHDREEKPATRNESCQAWKNNARVNYQGVCGAPEQGETGIQKDREAEKGGL